MSDPKILAVARGTLDRDLTAATPVGHSDVRVIVVSAARVVLVRTVRTYLQSLLGFLGATVVGVIPGDPLAPPDAWAKLATAAGLALFPAVIAAIQNVLELLAKLDTCNPELRG
jgi:hypothetical protein